MTTCRSRNFSASTASPARPKKPYGRQVCSTKRPRRSWWPRSSSWSGPGGDRAEKILASGRENDAAAAPLALAACLEILGKIDEASQQYALALKQKPDDPGLVRSVGHFTCGTAI